MPIPTPGQKLIPLDDWKRFLRVADWFERTIEQGKGVLPSTYGQALIVKTPGGGIDARDGETISSAACIKCVAVETATPGEKTIHETDEELLVYNLQTAAVSGDAFVKTALSPNGTRYVEEMAPGLGLDLGWDWGKLDTTLTPGGGVWMSIWRDHPLADTGLRVIVLAPPLMDLGSLLAGSWVWAQEHINGQWYVMSGRWLISV